MDRALLSSSWFVAVSLCTIGWCVVYACDFFLVMRTYFMRHKYSKTCKIRVLIKRTKCFFVVVFV